MSRSCGRSGCGQSGCGQACLGLPAEQCIDGLLAQLAKQVPDGKVHSTDGLAAGVRGGEEEGRREEGGKWHRREGGGCFSHG